MSNFQSQINQVFENAMSTKHRGESQIVRTSPERYHNRPGISSTQIRNALRCAQYAAFRNEVSEESPSLSLGEAIHAFVLDRDNEWKRFAVAPNVDRRTKAGKEEWASFQEKNQGRKIIKQDDFETVEGVMSALKQHPFVGGLLEKETKRELSIFTPDPDDNSVMWKARFDLIDDSSDQPIIYDLKTCQTASPGGFMSSIFKYNYHVQAAHYCNVFRLATGTTPRFRFIAVETKRPYLVGVYELDEDSMAGGEAEVRRGIKRLKELDAESNVNNSGYGDDVIELSIPKWKLTEIAEATE